MKRAERPNKWQGMHVRSLLLAEGVSVEGGGLHYGGKVVSIEPVGKNGHYFVVRVKTKLSAGQIEVPVQEDREERTETHAVPPFLLKTLGATSSSWSFESVGLSLEIRGKRLLLLTAPFVPLFSLLLEPPPTEYFRVDLRHVCDEQFSGSGEGDVKITRLHCKLDGDRGERISSITSIGKNVVTSDVTRDLLGYNTAAGGRATPFSSAALEKRVVKRSLDPVSCRMKWDDGSGSPATLNLDRYGNFSFYLKGTETLFGLTRIFNYLAKVDALRSSLVSPLDKSDAALQEVDVR